MANWHYYNTNGEKIGPIRGKELKQLTAQGTVTPETVVEDENGRTALAKQVTGLTFGETPRPAPPVSENPSSIIAPFPPVKPVKVPTPASSSHKVDLANLTAKGKELTQQGKENLTKGMNEVMGGLAAVKAAAQARLKLNALNMQLVAAFRALGDAAIQVGWGGELCEAIRTQKEEVAVATAQHIKATTDAELAKNTPGAGAAKQAASAAKTRMTLTAGILDGLREKAGRTLLGDTSAPSHVGTEQRAEITRLLMEITECESIIVHGKQSLISKPMLAAAACIVVALLGIYFGAGFLSENPSTVTRKCHVAFEKGDIKALIKLFPPEQAEVIRKVFSDKEALDDKRENQARMGRIKSIRHTIDGNNATVYVGYANGQSRTYNLTKIGGRWKLLN